MLYQHTYTHQYFPSTGIYYRHHWPRGVASVPPGEIRRGRSIIKIRRLGLGKTPGATLVEKFTIREKKKEEEETTVSTWRSSRFINKGSVSGATGDPVFVSDRSVSELNCKSANSLVLSDTSECASVSDYSSKNKNEAGANDSKNNHELAHSQNTQTKQISYFKKVTKDKLDDFDTVNDCFPEENLQLNILQDLNESDRDSNEVNEGLEEIENTEHQEKREVKKLVETKAEEEKIVEIKLQVESRENIETDKNKVEKKLKAKGKKLQDKENELSAFSLSKNQLKTSEKIENIKVDLKTTEAILITKEGVAAEPKKQLPEPSEKLGNSENQLKASEKSGSSKVDSRATEAKKEGKSEENIKKLTETKSSGDKLKAKEEKKILGVIDESKKLLPKPSEKLESSGNRLKASEKSESPKVDSRATEAKTKGKSEESVKKCSDNTKSSGDKLKTREEKKILGVVTEPKKQLPEPFDKLENSENRLKASENCKIVKANLKTTEAKKEEIPEESLKKLTDTKSFGDKLKTKNVKKPKNQSPEPSEKPDNSVNRLKASENCRIAKANLKTTEPKREEKLEENSKKLTGDKLKANDAKGILGVVTESKNQSPEPSEKSENSVNRLKTSENSKISKADSKTTEAKKEEKSENFKKLTESKPSGDKLKTNEAKKILGVVAESKKQSPEPAEKIENSENRLKVSGKSEIAKLGSKATETKNEARSEESIKKNSDIKSSENKLKSLEEKGILGVNAESKKQLPEPSLLKNSGNVPTVSEKLGQSKSGNLQATDIKTEERSLSQTKVKKVTETKTLVGDNLKSKEPKKKVVSVDSYNNDLVKQQVETSEKLEIKAVDIIEVETCVKSDKQLPGKISKNNENQLKVSEKTDSKTTGAKKDEKLNIKCTETKSSGDKLETREGKAVQGVGTESKKLLPEVSEESVKSRNTEIISETDKKSCVEENLKINVKNNFGVSTEFNKHQSESIGKSENSQNYLKVPKSNDLLTDSSVNKNENIENNLKDKACKKKAEGKGKKETCEKINTGIKKLKKSNKSQEPSNTNKNCFDYSDSEEEGEKLKKSNLIKYKTEENLFDFSAVLKNGEKKVQLDENENEKGLSSDEDCLNTECELEIEEFDMDAKEVVKKKKKVIIKKKGSKVDLRPLEAIPPKSGDVHVSSPGEITRQISKKRLSLVDDSMCYLVERRTSITDDIIIQEAAYFDSMIREEMRDRRKSSLGFPAITEEAEPQPIKQESRPETPKPTEDRRAAWKASAFKRSTKTLGGFYRPQAPDDESSDEDCDVNCHRKCQWLTPNLCGVNQKLMAEALSRLKVRSRASSSSGSATDSRTTSIISLNSSECSDSSETPTVVGRVSPPAKTLPRFRTYSIQDFHFLKVLGKGSYGKVLLAELKGSECYYAVKCLKKDVVLEDDDVECTLIERKVLALATGHPYFSHLFCTFQTESHLFFVMEYLNGGDLMFHIQQSGRFDEGRARFYAAEIVSGLSFLHKWGIVYRDLKLDNILLDFDGHVRIADFGMCKLQIYLDKTTDTFCGTPDYMAPEIIKGLKYNQCVDWWSFGIVLYELLVGQSPFSGCDEDDLFWSICNTRPHMPSYLSTPAKSILNALMEKDCAKRLGSTEAGAADVMNHRFFDGLKWHLLERKLLEPPFKPTMKHPLDTKYFDRVFTSEKPVLTPVDKTILESMDQSQFQGFSYTNPNATE